jgi:hypothetical protein
METRKLLEALGVGVMTTLVALTFYKGGSEVLANPIDTLWHPVIQGLLAAGTALGLRAIPSKAGNGTEPPK